MQKSCIFFSYQFSAVEAIEVTLTETERYTEIHKYKVPEIQIDIDTNRQRVREVAGSRTRAN